MIGVYDFTVILTYVSVISGVLGIVISLSGTGSPMAGVLFLLISGCCDSFDGRVARMKKNRSDTEKLFGGQIDSLSDLIAFGIEPVCIGFAVLKANGLLEGFPFGVGSSSGSSFSFVFLVIGCLYALCALIRLAWFNVLELTNTDTASGKRKEFVGLPVTASAAVFPIVIYIAHFAKINPAGIYFGAMLIVAVLFVCRFRIPKPESRMVAVYSMLGITELILWFVCVFNG